MAQIQPAKTFGRVLSASALKGDKVVNHQGEDLGKIGMGDKLFAIPWQAFGVDTVEKRLVLNADKELLKKAPGFDKSNWPDMADTAWGSKLYGYYGYKPYWD